MQEVPVTPQVNKSKSIKWHIFLVIILLILLVTTLIALAYFFTENLRLKKELKKTLEESAFVIDDSSESFETPPPQVSQSQIVSQNETWNLYTNYNLGFSILIPKSMYHSYGACEWKKTENSYRPLMGEVSVKVFEEGDHAYISSQYSYELSGERVENNIHYYSSCERQDNSLSKLEDKENFQKQHWKLISESVKNDTELTAFIQKHYGAGCKVAQKKPSNQTDVFDVTIDSIEIKKSGDESIGLEDLSCPVNYMYYIKYSPSRKKAITWIFGQSYTFFKNAKYDQYDEDMVKSFKMLD